jgi:serine protease Do
MQGTTKMILRYWLLAFLLVLPPLASAGLSETITLVKPGVVAIATHQKTRRPPNKFLGTGFVVGDGTLVATNAHVVPEVLSVENREQLVIMYGPGERTQIRQAKQVAIDVQHDMALLKIEGAPLPSLLLGDSKHVREGQSIAFTGFPIGTVIGVFPVTHRGIVSAISPVVLPAQSGRLLNAKMIKRLRDPFNIFQLDATAYPGNSGSPMYDPKTGKVLGMLNMVFVKETKETVIEKPSGITYAIPIKYLKALMATLP